MSGPGAGVGPGPAGTEPTHAGLAAPGWHYDVDRPDTGPRGSGTNPDTDAEPIPVVSDDIGSLPDQES